MNWPGLMGHIQKWNTSFWLNIIQQLIKKTGAIIVNQLNSFGIIHLLFRAKNHRILILNRFYDLLNLF